MTITLRHDKTTRQYEKYTSSDHGCIVSIYFAKEIFVENGRPIAPPRSLTMEVPINNGQE